MDFIDIPESTDRSSISGPSKDYHLSINEATPSFFNLPKLKSFSQSIANCPLKKEFKLISSLKEIPNANIEYSPELNLKRNEFKNADSYLNIIEQSNLMKTGSITKQIQRNKICPYKLNPVQGDISTATSKPRSPIERAQQVLCERQGCLSDVSSSIMWSIGNPKSTIRIKNENESHRSNGHSLQSNQANNDLSMPLDTNIDYEELLCKDEDFMQYCAKRDQAANEKAARAEKNKSKFSILPFS